MINIRKRRPDPVCFGAGLLFGAGIGALSSGEGSDRRRSPVMMGFIFDEACLIGAGIKNVD